MRMANRSLCPSCHHRISPLALECPVCGLTLERRQLPRPLIFQASAIQSAPTPPQATAPAPRVAISTPALGRVTPIPLPEPAKPDPGLALRISPAPVVSLPDEGAGPSLPPEADESFWPLVMLEFSESFCLLAINGILVLIATWLVGISTTRTYSEFWPFLVPVHFAVSWAFEMVPLTLVGQSPLMGTQGLLLDASQPERRIAFSLMHLCSVLLFPVSFFCMVLTPTHRTLGEILSGQEILLRPEPRLR